MKKGKNIVLWGHTASGKTSLGLCLARKIGLGFIDTDKCIEKKEKKDISEIFEGHGEDYFRKVEAELVQSLKTCCNHVIAVGGGTLQYGKNQEIL